MSKTTETECCVDTEAKSCVDYETEWYRQREMIMKLESENKELRSTIIGMCKHLYGEEGAE